MKRYKLIIKGRVQGVWYRGSAQRKARELGLNGFIKNMPDGSVYAEAEGNESNLDVFIEWCKKGPELARVEAVLIEETGTLGQQGFEVHR
ncbi:MAG: acylphosphatase [Lewinellaceae bacterium]|nr:acylphosphatase [Saprospiraceae bacterium]MCB9338169.1 acylphosphatase [Lewinellaceae bacterium]